MIDTPGKDDSHFRKPTSSFLAVQPITEARPKSVIKPPRSVRFLDDMDPKANTECLINPVPPKIIGRRSLPPLPSALMQSILKDCTPEKMNQRKSKSFTSPRVEAGENAPTTVSPSEVMKAALNGNPSQKVSTLNLPTGYIPGPQGAKGRYQCPVEGCEKKYTRRHTLLEHLKVSVQ
jgi:hypothetical protein